MRLASRFDGAAAGTPGTRRVCRRRSETAPAGRPASAGSPAESARLRCAVRWLLADLPTSRTGGGPPAAVLAATAGGAPAGAAPPESRVAG